jgi:hypothetical protein
MNKYLLHSVKRVNRQSVKHAMIKTAYRSIMKMILLNRPEIGLSLVTAEFHVHTTVNSSINPYLI